MTLRNPTISVIVPCYNYAAYLHDLINSLKSQSFQNWECILVDDDSTDNTKAVAMALSNDDSRIKYVHQQNAGPAAARSKGLTSALGDYIQFIDADDFIGSEKFEIELSLFQANKHVDVVYSGYSFVDRENNRKWIDEKKWQSLSEQPFNDLVNYWEKGLMIPIHSFLFSKKCFDQWGGFDKQFKTHEDWDLNLNFSLNGAKYCQHNYCGAYYRIHSSSSSRTDLTLNRKDTLGVLKKYMYSERSNAFQKKILKIRYYEFIADFFIEKIKYNRIKFIKTLDFNANPLLNSIALLGLPVFVMKKIITKSFGLGVK